MKAIAKQTNAAKTKAIKNGAAISSIETEKFFITTENFDWYLIINPIAVKTIKIIAAACINTIGYLIAES